MIGNVSQIYSQNNQASAIANASNFAVNSDKLKNGSQIQETKKDTNLSTRVTISEEALKIMGLSQESKTGASTQSTSDQSTLSAEELKQVSDLKSRDREVRTHEMAHVMVGGSLVRKGASYQYQTGPDGQRYAVGGEVSIDSSAVSGDPSATIRKMEQVKRAAMAPANPSSQDRAVASSAAQAEAAARMQLLQQGTES